MAGSLSSTRVGGVLGAGVEYRISQNWSAKVEYLYYNFGYRSYGLGLAAYTAGVAFPGAGIASIAPSASTRFNGNIVRAGLNYQFAPAAAPILARY